MVESAPVGRPKVRAAGFTVIELMIVVMIIGLLSSIAALKINQAMRKANEGSSHGNLGAIRSSIGIYYNDNVTTYPGSLAALTLNGKYLKAFPETTSPFSPLGPSWRSTACGARSPPPSSGPRRGPTAPSSSS